MHLYALPTVKQSTYISYESYVRLHLEPALGTSKLTTLTVELLQRFFNQKKQSLSPKSLRNIYNMLHNCLDQAVTNGYLMRNPLQGVKLPQVTKKEMIILTHKKNKMLSIWQPRSPTQQLHLELSLLSAPVSEWVKCWAFNGAMWIIAITQSGYAELLADFKK